MSDQNVPFQSNQSQNSETLGNQSSANWQNADQKADVLQSSEQQPTMQQTVTQQTASQQPATQQTAPQQPAEQSTSMSQSGVSQPIECERYQLHHSYIWLSALRGAPYIFAAVLFSSFSGVTVLADDLGLTSLQIPFAVGVCLLLTLVIFGIAVGCSAIGYRYRWYEFGISEFSSYWGIFNKNRSHVPYQRIQSVNEQMSLLQRLVGVCTVTIETAGGENNKALVIPYVEKSAAERIRREVFTRKSLMVSSYSAQTAQIGQTAQSIQPAQVSQDEQSIQAAQQSNVLDMPATVMDDMRGIFAHAEIDTGTVTCEFGLSNKELVLAALSSKTSFVFVLIGVISALSTLLGGLVDARIISSSEAIYSTAWQAMAGPLGLVGFVAILVLLLFLWLISVGSSCLTYAGFRSRRRGNRVEVERGLITHVFSGMDVERIQSIHIHQSFFQRLLKCCSVAYGRVGAMGEEEGSNNSLGATAADKLVVHPFLPLSRVPEIIAGLTPEYQTLPQATKPVDKKALRRALTRRVIWQGLGFWLLVILACIWALLALLASSELSQEFFPGMTLMQSMVLVSGAVIALIVVIAAFEAVNAVLWYRNAAMGWDHFGFTIVNGGFSIDIVTVPRTKIQAALIRTNPLQRHAKVASVLVDTAEGVGSTRHRLRDVSQHDADEWLAWACPRGGNSGGTLRVEP